MPAKHFYSPENMNPKVYEEFNEWYDKHEGKLSILKKK
jgi:hypothetical protein